MTDRTADRELVKEIIANNERALSRFYDTYKKSIFQFVYRQITDKGVAEEILQDIFIDFFEALRDFHHQSSVKTFLYAIAKNKVIDYIRKKKVKRVLFSALPAFWVENIASVAFDDDLERKEIAGKIQSTLETLPDDYKLVLRLKYVDGVRVKHIAEQLKIGFKATESLIFRARKAFVKVFNESA